MKIAVLGCGLMGVRIAGELAYHGHRVKIFDSNGNALDKVFERLQDDKRMLHEEGLIPQEKFIGQVYCMSRLEETVRDADFIFEVIIEKLDAKKDIFERVSHLCKADAVIASNTMGLSIDELTERTVGKERTLGLRFLFPVYYIPELEITPGPNTSAITIEKVRVLLEKMGKTLFFRSGGNPLILSEEQREARKCARLEQIKLGAYEKCVPALSHRGNITPKAQEESLVASDLDRDCAICMDRLRDCLMQPCHHMVTCYECSKMLFNRKDGCPICRKNIKELIKVYHS
ncbi:3-hydroxybutyryl-CoA dehydrogenase-like [Gigantopelta aegis]|uniref:3-hydroxybutyryl-CoA dehydrogenase-like n=1 Tax=Gigantopelta aegis TaxID=1735272 RepID=UPI001B8894AF|nr:3-hydroxybutyryl-CoA dehydrogenase-like [Gigantopelta aegis]